MKDEKPKEGDMWEATDGECMFNIMLFSVLIDKEGVRREEWIWSYYPINDPSDRQFGAAFSYPKAKTFLPLPKGLRMKKVPESKIIR